MKTLPKTKTVIDFREHVTSNEPVACDVYCRITNRYIFVGNFVQDKVVLDTGCSVGLGTSYWQKKGARSIIGVDIDREAIEEAKTCNNGATFLVADVQALPFPDNSFDTIIALEIIEHLEDANAFLAECQRLLKAEGNLICSTPNRKVASPLFNKPRNPYHTKEFNLQEFRTIISNHFANIDLYEQRISHSRIRFKLVAIADSVITAIVGRGKIREFLIRLSYPVSAQPHYLCFSRDFTDSIDKHYAVTKLNNDKTPETLIVVAQGSKC